MTQETPQGKQGRYRAILSNWDERASVRRAPRRMVDGAEAGKLPFSPELVPVTSHPIVKARGPDVFYEVLARRLFCYLRFTDVLETDAVVPAALLLSRGAGDLKLPDGMAFDGKRIATDEMYHAQCADDMIRQMAKVTGVIVPQPPIPSFLLQLQAIRATVPKEMDHLALIFFSIVSETLITAILKGVPDDERVFTGVRELDQGSFPRRIPTPCLFLGRPGCCLAADDGGAAGRYRAADPAIHKGIP